MEHRRHQGTVVRVGYPFALVQVDGSEERVRFYYGSHVPAQGTRLEFEVHGRYVRGTTRFVWRVRRVPEALGRRSRGVSPPGTLGGRDLYLGDEAVARVCQREA